MRKTSPGLKINLYRDYEVEALGMALDRLGSRAAASVECVMVGDSYFMTHGGRATTKLETLEDQAWGVDVLSALVREVSGALDRVFPENRPFLVADFPDGATASRGTALDVAHRMVDAGADVVKIEIASDESLDALDALRSRGFHVMAHVGYTPQGGTNRRYGDTFAEACEIFAAARRVRDLGASSLVLEMVSEAVNVALSAENPGSIPIYSIFSGRAPYGGQSINVWDSVFVPSFKSRYFPPTAEYSREEYPAIYTRELIATKLTELVGLTLSGAFPLSPASKMSARDLEALRAIDPWEHEEASPASIRVA